MSGEEAPNILNLDTWWRWEVGFTLPVTSENFKGSDHLVDLVIDDNKY
jgi:hypothetical protein